MTSPYVPEVGDVVWIDSGTKTLAQEECGRHPWVVLSKSRANRESGVFVAVPMTSNSLPYKNCDVNIYKPDFDDIGGLDGRDATVRCHKLRHWSNERVESRVAVVGELAVRKIRNVLADLLGILRK